MITLHRNVAWIALSAALACAGCGSNGNTVEPTDTDTDVTDTDDTDVVMSEYDHAIYVMFSAHGHNYGFKAPNSNPAQWKLMKQNKYTERKTEVEWLRDEADSYGIKMSFQLNGEYCRDARLGGTVDDTQHIKDLVIGGHSVGTHFHPYAFTGNNEFWQHYENNEVTPTVMENIWRTQIDEVELALGGQIRRIDPAGPRNTTDLEDKYAELMAEYGFDAVPVGEVFTYTEWEHKPWTPFRLKFPTPLLEDADSDFVGMTSIGQIGQIVPEGKHALTLGVGQIKRRFMMAYAEWLHQRLAGETETIFNFGMMTHPDSNLEYRDEVGELMRFFGEEVSTWKGPNGEPVIQFVSDEGVIDAYYEWELEHPGESSFSFDYDAHASGSAQPYPYVLGGITTGLMDAEFDAVVTDGLASNVTVLSFQYREVFRQNNAFGEPAMTITGVGELQDKVYLVVADAPTVVDLSTTVTGAVFIKAGDTGAVTSGSAASISAGIVPVLVATSDAHF